MLPVVFNHINSEDFYFENSSPILILISKNYASSIMFYNRTLCDDQTCLYTEHSLAPVYLQNTDPGTSEAWIIQYFTINCSQMLFVLEKILDLEERQYQLKRKRVLAGSLTIFTIQHRKVIFHSSSVRKNQVHIFEELQQLKKTVFGLPNASTVPEIGFCVVPTQFVFDACRVYPNQLSSERK